MEKDLLWLELQAWISDRTPQEQDNYLYVQRKKIPGILNRIMEYRFQPFYSDEKTQPDYSQSSDAGASFLHGTVPLVPTLVNCFIYFLI